MTPTQQYCVYGVTVRSEFPLALPDHDDGTLASIDIQAAPAAHFEEAMRGVEFHPGSDSWYQYAFLPDGSSYVRWEGIGEFLVSADGRRIQSRKDDAASAESFHVYMLGQSLSYALVKLGFEPLHATVVVIDGEAVGFLGESGFGKSTLAASFLAAGHRILTDDLLIVRESAGVMLAYPGPQRLKVFPKVARKFLQPADLGVPMNAGTRKLIVPLDRSRTCATPVPLRALYSLVPPEECADVRVPRVQHLSLRESFVELVRHTFNYRLVNPARLERQFLSGTGLVAQIPVRKLYYKRSLSQIERLQRTIFDDLGRGIAPAPPLRAAPLTEALACG